MKSSTVASGLRRVRVGLYVVVVAAVVYLSWRFDTLPLPEGSCSPVRSIAPGSRLFVDLRPGELRDGDAVIFRAADGDLLLGVVGPPPESLPADVAGELAAGALWIAADDPTCPARDSRALGPIPRADVAGRVFLSL